MIYASRKPLTQQQQQQIIDYAGSAQHARDVADLLDSLSSARHAEACAAARATAHERALIALGVPLRRIAQHARMSAATLSRRHREAIARHRSPLHRAGSNRAWRD